MEHDNEWHRVLLGRPTYVQTIDDFLACRGGSMVMFLSTVWRQNIVHPEDKRGPIYRHVFSKEKPQ